MRPHFATRRFRQAPLVAAIAAALLPIPAQAITYTVTNGLDNSGNNPTPGLGTGTLRQAIVDANANCTSDSTPVIAFAIGTSPTFIGIGSPAPSATNPLPQLLCSGSTYSPTIDATTQPGSVPNSDPTGFNGTFGILLDGSGLTAPGSCGIAFAQNVVNGGALTVRGIFFTGFTAGGNSAGLCGSNMNVFGNTFSSNSEGVKVLASGTALIGNTSAGDRNYIHANTIFGVNAVNANTVNVVNSLIGTTPDGNGAQPNGIGVNMQNTALMQLNGNVISGNSFDGVRLFATPGLITGNLIGIGTFGGVVPNQTGIRTDNSAALVDIVNNSILNNTTFGVHVASGVSVRMTNNSITANTVKNVTLDMYGGPVPNDPQDPDTGPNNRQNFPVISLVTPEGPNTRVFFTFNSTPGANFDLDFYSNSGPGIPGGATYLSTQPLATDANGDSLTPSTLLTGSVDFISMAARRVSTQDTSEFSPIVAKTGLPAVIVSPANLTFGNVPINTTSPSITSTLQSSGTSAYQISQMSTGSCYGGPICYGGAEFTCMTDCVPFQPYNPGTSCTLTASFSPTSIGPQSVNVVVCDNAIGSPRTIALTGNGVPAATLTILPSSYDYGNVPVGTQSAPVFFTVQNPNATPTALSATTNGPFGIVASSCGPTLNAASSCDLGVVFASNAAGLLTGNLVVQPAGGTATTAALIGTGTVSPVLGMPSGVDLPYTLGRPPTSQRVTLSNTGLAPLTFTSISISGAPFTLLSECPTTLAPGSSCDLVIGFSSPTLGVTDGTLTVVSNAPGGSRTIPLRGITQPRDSAFLEVTPIEIGYGNRAFGTTGESQLVTVRNVGRTPAVFDSLVASADFVILSHSCTGPLAPLTTCEARVAARPTAYGVRFGALTITSNAENSPNRVALSGTGCRASSLVVPRLGGRSGCGP